jgi:hypothetical protein
MAMRRRVAWLALIVALVTIGCTETQPTKFYILSAETAPTGGAVPRGPKTPVVGVANAALPGYLDRPQIVSRTSANAMDIDEFHRWAEPLDSLFTRILAQNLSGNLGRDAIVELAGNRSGSFDYLVEIDVLRFDSEAKERAVLDARWRLVDAARERVISRGQVIADEPIDAPGDYEAVVAAMSRAEAVLSREIAAAIKAKPR